VDFLSDMLMAIMCIKYKSVLHWLEILFFRKSCNTLLTKIVVGTTLISQPNYPAAASLSCYVSSIKYIVTDDVKKKARILSSLQIDSREFDDSTILQNTFTKRFTSHISHRIYYRSGQYFSLGFGTKVAP